MYIFPVETSVVCSFGANACAAVHRKSFKFVNRELVNPRNRRLTLLMTTKRVKIQFTDDHGTKHTVTIEGQITREKVSQLLDYVELMAGTVGGPSSERSFLSVPSHKFDRLTALVLGRFSGRIFSSKDVQREYEAVYNDRPALSTVSTYLSRLVDKGLVTRSGSSSQWRYAVRQPASPGPVPQPSA